MTTYYNKREMREISMKLDWDILWEWEIQLSDHFTQTYKHIHTSAAQNHSYVEWVRERVNERKREKRRDFRKSANKRNDTMENRSC